MEIELNRAAQTASTEANAASAANNEGKEVAMTGEEDSDTSEVDELIDYNEQDEIEAAKKVAEQKELKKNANEQRICVEKHSQIRESERSLHFPIFERK